MLISLLFASAVAIAYAQTYSFVLKWGSTGSDNGQFSSPSGIAVDSAGNIYVADTGNNRIQKFNSSGTYLTSWRNPPGLNQPQDVAVDNAGNIIVSDSVNNRVLKFDSSGNIAWTNNGSDTPSPMVGPSGVAVDSSGDVYVANPEGSRIFKINGATGNTISSIGGYGSPDGAFQNCTDIAADNLGNAYVVDTGNNRIQKFAFSGFPPGVFTSKWGINGSGNGQFNAPKGIVIDSAGNVYLADTGNNRVQKFNASGTFLTSWGIQGSGDGQFNTPQSIAGDGSGNVYVMDVGNNRVQKFNTIEVIPEMDFTAMMAVLAAITVTMVLIKIKRVQIKLQSQ